MPVAPGHEPNREAFPPSTTALPATHVPATAPQPPVTSVPQPAEPVSVPPPPVQPRRRRGRKILIALVAVILVLAAAAAVVFFALPAIDASKSPASTVTGAEPGAAPTDKTDAFKLVLPEGWRSATKQELAEAPGQPLAIVRREDGKAFVVIRRTGRMPKDVQAFMAKLDGEFSSRFDDFQRQSAKVIEVRGGKAYNYLYIRKEQGTVESVTVVPVARGSFTLSSIVEGGNEGAARQVGRIIASFDA